MESIHATPQEAYEAAEDYFGHLTKKGWGKPYRKYQNYESFYTAYARRHKNLE